MRMTRGDHCVESHAQIAVGSVLEADRHREPARQLAMGLALARACADRRPAHEVGRVLRRDRVEHLAAARQTELVDLTQDGPREAEAGRDVARIVEVRIVDQALPADRRARLLEVRAHDDHQLLAQLDGDTHETAGILVGRSGIMNRARTDDDQEARPVPPVQDVADRMPGVEYHLGGARRER
jgi:hypothetical protein